jgi:hypothetical protein
MRTMQKSEWVTIDELGIARKTLEHCKKKKRKD